MRVYNGSSLLVHYGAPVITRQNTVVAPVKTGSSDGFRVEARAADDGATKWMIDSDYSMPAHSWVLAFGIALTPKNRVCFPGAGGTVRFRDSPDVASGSTGKLVFYGEGNYLANPASFNARVKINTPITSDRYGNLYFGFEVTAPGTSNPSLQSGLARIAEDGTGSWVSAKVAAGDTGMSRLPHNCAPVLSNDQRTLYFAVSAGDFKGGYLVSVDSRTLEPINKVRLRDALDPTKDGLMPDNGSASPTVGPDGDVYFGVIENPFLSNNFRGYLLHFDATLSQTKTTGSFGWDDTPSIVPASLVPSYQGSSPYLLLTKANNYAGYGTGDGRNKLALNDPNATMSSPINGATVMKEVLSILGPTPDAEKTANYPNAVREWCINMAAVDPFKKSAIASCEDGKTYRWDFATNTFSESITLTDGIGEAYTPTLIGVDGTVYAIANGTLYVIGAAAP